MSNATVVVLTEVENPQWRWIEPRLADTGVNLEFVRSFPKNDFERALPASLIQMRAAFRAAKTARRIGAKAATVHGPRLAVWFGLFSNLLGVRIPVIVYRFNFGSSLLPSESKRPIYNFVFSRFDRFVVSSQVERALYAKAFSLPIERFDFVLWALWPPRVERPETPLEAGEYISAIGSNARDYKALAEAARQLPNLRFVIVVRPENLIDLSLPPNVTVHVNLPLGDTMNVLQHSRFMVLPLLGGDVPNGHDTIVAAMHLSKAIIVTNSSGVHDYVRDGDKGATVGPGSVDSLVGAIKRFWNDPALCARLGQDAQRFAASECTPDRVADHFRGWLQAHGLTRSFGCKLAARPVLESD